jgi:Uma2 family endonuclease
MKMASQSVSPVETVSPPAPPAHSLPPREERPGEHRFLIRNIDWATYRKISEALNERHFHMSFDGEALELRTTSDDHAWCSRLLGDFVVVLTEETGQPRRTSGDMTMDREDLEKGIEADESFYLVNEARVGGKKIDLSVDPPPDLGIEIDLTTDSRRRFGIYGKIGVPEIWRYDGQAATIYHRQPSGEYQPADRSRYFPFLSAADLTRFLALREQMEENALLRAFREWVREQIGKK